MKMTRLLMLTLIMGWSTSLYSQGKIDLAGINYTYTPFSNLDNIPSGVAALEDFGIAVKQLEIFVNVPVPISEEVILIISPYYELIDFAYENDEMFPGDFAADNIHKIQLKASLTWRINESWNVTLFNSPNLSSDFRDDLSGDDLFNQPGFLVNRVINERLTVGLGLVASFVFGDQQIFPILSLRYLSENGKFFVNVTFPNVRLIYALSGKFDVGLLLKLRGNEFNYVNRPIPLTNESTDFLRFSNTLLGPEITYHLTEKLGLRLSGGINTNRKFEFFDTNSDEIGDVTPKDSGFISGGLVFSVPTN